MKQSLFSKKILTLSALLLFGATALILHSVLSRLASGLLQSTTEARTPSSFTRKIETEPASVFFVESIDSDKLKKKYTEALTTGNKVNILIVPGHEPHFGGTEYKGVKERDLASDLGETLFSYLKEDPHVSVVISRDKSEWNPKLKSYFDTQWDSIKRFKDAQEKKMTTMVKKGRVSNIEDLVYHNSAPNDVALRLYGINKWANENDIDITIHLHFNDYPHSTKIKKGEYSGFSIYVPEAQYSNAKATKDIAQAVFNKLGSFLPVSDFSGENDGIVEDQQLIAVGSNNSVDGASMLIEYAYIYEPLVTNEKVRHSMLRELAFQTYSGIQSFFGGKQIASKYNTTLLPHTWASELTYGVADSLDVASLQVALSIEGTYPPVGKTKNECPLTGIFGDCMKEALTTFQSKNNIVGEKGVVGFKTRKMLNDLYSI